MQLSILRTTTGLLKLSDTVIKCTTFPSATLNFVSRSILSLQLLNSFTIEAETKVVNYSHKKIKVKKFGK